MKKIVFAILPIVGLFNSASAQPTWAEDVAPIIYDNCVLCHHDGGLAPFSLMDYQACYDNGVLIEHEVTAGKMPPWPADPDWRHFSGETILTDTEKQMIYDWVAGGRLQGNMGNAPTPPTFSSGGSVLDFISFTAEIPPYTLQENVDEYRWFVIPTNFPDTVYIERIETIPGQPSVVHHCDVSYDLSGISAAADAADPLPGFGSGFGTANYDFYMNAWSPGAIVAKYPENWGIMLPPGADLVVEIHYGPSGQGLLDTTKLNFQFIPPPHNNVRPVYSGWLMGQNAPTLIDGPLFIPANTEQTFHQITPPLTFDMSVVGVAPHMHYLGKSYKIWAITPSNDSINICYIPNWDFHWQKYYFFPIIQYLPQGTVLYSEGVYDNTVFNEHNPNVPPIDVGAGPNTTDEMFLSYFIYSWYEPGDENIVMDSLIAFAGAEEHQFADSYVYPNPTKDKLNILFNKPLEGVLNIEIFDMQGRRVKALRLLDQGHLQSTIDVNDLKPGMYLIKYENSGVVSSSVFARN